MQVQCTKCRASGNVKVEDPSRRFKCPKCGGEMVAVKAGSGSTVVINRNPAATQPAVPPQQPPASQTRVGSSTSRVPTSQTRPAAQPQPGNQTRPVASQTHAATSQTSVSSSTRVGTRPPTPGAASAPAGTRATQTSSVLGRRPRKKSNIGKLIGIAVAVLVVVGLGVGGYFFLMPILFGAGPGTQAMEMLPPNTIAAGSIEGIQVIQSELQAGSAEGSPIREAIGSFNRNARQMLVNQLDISEGQAADIVRATTSLAFGVVPLEEAGVGQVTMLILSKSPASYISNMKDGGEASGRKIYEGRGVHAMAINNMLVISSSREPLAKMANDVAKGSKQTLGNVLAFTQARDLYAKKAIGWLYIPGTALKNVSGAFNKGGSASVPEFESLVVAIKRQEMAVVAEGALTLLEETAPLLATRTFKTADLVPDDVTCYAAISVEKPTAVYKKIITSLDEASKAHTKGGISNAVAQWENSEPKIKLDSDIIAPIAGEIAFYAPADGGFVLLVPGTTGDRVRSAVSLLARKFGADSEMFTHKKVKMTKITKPIPFIYGFADNTLVVTNNPDNVIAISEAVSKKKTLSASEEYQNGLSEESSIKIVWRNKKGSGQGDNKFNLLDFKMNKNGGTLTAMMPNFADAVVAMAPPEISVVPPPEAASPVPPIEPIEPIDPGEAPVAPVVPEQPGEQPKYTGAAAVANENILKLHALFKRYLDENQTYPTSFASLMREYITEENKAILVWPGDQNPIFNTYPTSYATAFDVTDFAFDATTPADTPMIWEVMAAHGSRRFVVYFDGSCKLVANAVSNEALVKAAVAKMKEEAKNAPAEEPAEEEQPVQPPEQEMPPDGRIIKPAQQLPPEEEEEEEPPPQPRGMLKKPVTRPAGGGMNQRQPAPAKPAPAKPAAIKMPKLPPDPQPEEE